MKPILLPLAALAVLTLAAAPEPPARQTFRPVDDGRALVNPYMGWTCHFYSNVPTNYGSHLAPADALDWFEGCSTVYLRIPWAFIEPEEGKFQWSILDTPAQRWISRGKQVAFRFTTSVTVIWTGRWSQITIIFGEIDTEQSVYMYSPCRVFSGS